MPPMNIKEKMTGLLSLPEEITLNLPMVTVTGRVEVNVENYKNIVEYTDTTVRINTATGLLVVEGNGLALKQITAEYIVVSGAIGGLRFI